MKNENTSTCLSTKKIVDWTGLERCVILFITEFTYKVGTTANENYRKIVLHVCMFSRYDRAKRSREQIRWMRFACTRIGNNKKMATKKNVKFIMKKMSKAAIVCVDKTNIAIFIIQLAAIKKQICL